MLLLFLYKYKRGKKAIDNKVLRHSFVPLHFFLLFALYFPPGYPKLWIRNSLKKRLFRPLTTVSLLEANSLALLRRWGKN